MLYLVAPGAYKSSTSARICCDLIGACSIHAGAIEQARSQKQNPWGECLHPRGFGIDDFRECLRDEGKKPTQSAATPSKNYRSCGPARDRDFTAPMPMAAPKRLTNRSATLSRRV